jgi:PAS domain S-box-containing protein
MTITPVKNTQGQITHFVAIKQDITERKRADEAQAMLAAIVESSENAILSKTLGGVISSWNAGAQRLFGYQAEEIIGQSIMRLIGPDRLSEEREIIARLSRGERVENFETLRLAKDGRPIDVSLTVSPLKDRQGNVVGASIIHHDITERIQAEKEIKRIAADLARSNRDLEQFASVASHDLQEPLRMVIGYLQLIERRYKDKLDADAQQFIAFAVDGATRMSRLVTDLLDFSRVNTRGKQPEPVEMETVLKRALENLQAAIRDSDAQITHDPLPTVQGDASQLVQLMQNLVGNAIKFRSPDRPVRICIGAQKKDDEWVFSVKDEGIGIEPQYAEKIFLIFQRLHSRAEYPGTGIGLAICKKIVERHGGRIWVESQSGQGSTFFFTINHAVMER